MPPPLPALTFKQQLRWTLLLCVLLAVIEVINLFTSRALNQYGLIPRQLSHLAGIFSAPLLHGNLLHFFSNIIPFALFSFLLLQHGLKRYIQVSVISIALGGTLVWLLARDAIHIGSSGLIYSYFAYLVFSGIVSRKLKHVLISLFVGIGYGGLVFGILPTAGYISWESHLFGFLVGLACAYFFEKK